MVFDPNNHRCYTLNPVQKLIKQEINDFVAQHGRAPRKILIGYGLAIVNYFSIPMEHNPILHNLQFVLLR